MNDNQRRRYERLGRVLALGSRHTSSFPPDSRGGKAITSLTSILRSLEALDASRSTNKSIVRQGTLAKNRLKESLRELLAMLNRTVNTMALDMPEMKGKFPLPHLNANTQELLAAARSALEEAAPLKDKLLDYDMPADFLAELERQITDFETASGEQNTGASARVSDSAAINDAIKRGEEDMDRFDTALRNTFRDDPAIIQEWEAARKLERAPRASKAGKDGAGAQKEGTKPST